MLVITNRSVVVLFGAQALFWCCTVIGITLTSIAGLELAPTAALATVPFGTLVLGTLASIHVVARAMQRHGRRVGFSVGALFGSLGALICAGALIIGSFALFCLGTFLIGIYQASAGFYRYAAMDAVDQAHTGRAAAYVLGAGVCAAIVGPWLALWSSDLFNTRYLGAYLVIAVLATVAALVLTRVPPGKKVTAAASMPARPAMRTLLSKPSIRTAIAVTAIGHGVMVLAMNATPLAIQHLGHPASHSAQVIQWHVLGMFFPAFFAGALVDTFGSRTIALAGIATLLASSGLATAGDSMPYFLPSSILLGVGWNLTIISGTTLLANACSEAEASPGQALMELINGGTAVLMSSASGVLLALAGWAVLNLAMVPVLLVAAAWVWSTGRTVRDEPEQAGPQPDME